MFLTICLNPVLQKTISLDGLYEDEGNYSLDDLLNSQLFKVYMLYVLKYRYFFYHELTKKIKSIYTILEYEK